MVDKNHGVELGADEAIQFDLNAIDRAFIDNPYPTLANLRAHDPVHFNLFGSNSPPLAA